MARVMCLRCSAPPVDLRQGRIVLFEMLWGDERELDYIHRRGSLGRGGCGPCAESLSPPTVGQVRRSNRRKVFAAAAARAELSAEAGGELV
jgi:hypothetical protein